ncbi:MAG: MMPL family transporter [Thermodesulfobacteriota bacterium]|nr:MMPL family transporter [Thermodesulfobacteriota bacterium]
MTHTDSKIRRFYASVLNHPWRLLVVFFIVIGMLGYFAKDFQIDASADTLANESDEDIQYARKIDDRYNIQSFLVIAYTPQADLLSDKVLDDIAALRDELTALEGVASVMTLLDVPLLESPPVPVKELAGSLPTLRSSGVNMELARQELKTSPLYRNLLVSPDLKTTGIQINLTLDSQYMEMVKRRDALANKSATTGLTAAQSAELERLEEKIYHARNVHRRENQQLIASIRAIMASHEKGADLFLGGVSMIANDLIRFIKNDLKIFGAGVFFFLVLMLGIIFRKPRWVVLPMLCCVFSTVAMMGLLGLFGWKVTVISSNFISLQLIITMAIAIHLVVRYRELLAENPAAAHYDLVIETVRLKLTPCLYAGLTTVAGFGSLLLCDIKPVITFGWMMVGGIAVSLLVSFLFFPAALVLLKKTPPPPASGGGGVLTSGMAALTRRHGGAIVAVSAAALIVSVVGISRLTVENAFVNYFKKSTEIYQGMKVIDQQLGGTTPLDVILNFAGDDAEKQAQAGGKAADNAAGKDDFDMFAEFEAEQSGEQYWFTPYKMNRIESVHDYLDSIPVTGKVLSLGTMLKVAHRLNNGKPLDSFELPLIYNELPDKYRDQLVSPFVSVEHDQARMMVRIVDTSPSLRRNQLIHTIKTEIMERFGFGPDEVRLTGMLVLYNNMLQSLFDSQIKTLGVVLLALMIMFLVLFRSVKVSVIAIAPNVLAIAVVLGVIGWLKIPLDMMTITIAAISVGIAVDDTIHYIHRFKREYLAGNDYYTAMERSHGSIGYAMYYTSVTIIIGFSILALSNFIPTIVFGLLTGLAMLIALIAALTLLPHLIVRFKPFGPEQD